MTENTTELSRLIRDKLPDGGFLVAGGRDLYMEVVDTETGLVWMSSQPVEQADFESLTLAAPLTKVGIGRSAMDGAAFAYSPAAPGDIVREREISGYHFINVAAPGTAVASDQADGPIEISVNKAHIVGFEQGRTVAIMHLAGEDFVELVGDTAEDATRVLPAGASIRQIVLTEPWVVSLPTPTRTFFWWGETMRSFQGPVTLPVT